MKRNYFILLLFLMGFKIADAKNITIKKDTTIIEFIDKNLAKKVTVLSPNESRIYLPKSLNLDKLLSEIGVDSTEKEKTLIIIGGSKNKSDTLFVFNKEGNRIKIITKDNLFAKSDSLNNKRNSDNDNDVNTTQRNSNIDSDCIDCDDEEEEIIVTKNSVNKNFFKKNDFGFYFGLNTAINPPIAKAPNSLYELNGWGSRYVAVSWRKNIRLSSSKNMDFAISLGPELSWSNFMFVDNNMIFFDRDTRQVRFSTSTYSLQKSKLVVPSLNLPILFNFGFNQSKFNIGIGGFLGYRYGGYSKIKTNERDKFREKSNFGMTDFQYGLTMEIGKKRGFAVFCRYNLNELFKSNQVNAQGLKPISFGIRI